MADDQWSAFSQAFNMAQGIKDRKANRELEQKKFELQKQGFELNKQQTQQDMAIKGEKWQYEKKQYQNQEDQTKKELERQQLFNAAFKQGGYAAVQVAADNYDPVMGMEIRKKKAEMDQSIISTAKIRFETEDAKNKYVNSAHTLIGNMAAPVLAEKDPDKRAALYESQAPLFQQVDPSMPSVYNEKAFNHMLISMGVAIPASQRFEADQKAKEMKTNEGKAIEDINNLVDKGYSVDSPEVKSLKEVMDTAKNARIIAEMKALDERTKRVDDLRDYRTKTQDGFTKSTEAFGNIQAAVYNDDKPNDAKDLAIMSGYIRLLSPNAKISATGELSGTEGVPEMITHWYNVVLKGEGKLPPEKRREIIKLSNDIYNRQKQTADTLDAGVADIARRRGFNLKDVFTDHAELQRQESVTRIKGLSIPNDLKAWAEQKIMKEGKKPEEVESAVQRIIQSKQQQSQGGAQ